MNKLLLFLSIIPVYFVGLYIYNKDKDKEPKQFLKKLFLGGFLSIIITIALTFIINFIPIFSLELDNLNMFELFINVFIGIALIEEFSKWIIVYKFSYNSENFDELYDMIVYAVFVSLGFACIENILYVFENGIFTALLRAILSIPGHACFGLFMGYYLGLSKLNSINNNKLKSKNIILSILIPTILHGIFDYCLFSKKEFLIVFYFIFVIFLYIVSIKKINKISSITNKILKKNNYCGNCGYKVTGNFCTKCGIKIE